MIWIREAIEADLEPMLAIYNDIILNTTAVYEYRPHSMAMRRSWFEKKQEDHFPVIVAMEDEELLGFGSLGPFRAWAAYRYTVENSVYVASAHRGKGIGKMLVSPLIESAKQLDLHAIIAGIDASNEASLRLHRSFGFEEVAHFRQVGYKFGRWLDLKFLQLLLETPLKPVDS